MGSASFPGCVFAHPPFRALIEPLLIKGSHGGQRGSGLATRTQTAALRHGEPSYERLRFQFLWGEKKRKSRFSLHGPVTAPRRDSHFRGCCDVCPRLCGHKQQRCLPQSPGRGVGRTCRLRGSPGFGPRLRLRAPSVCVMSLCLSSADTWEGTRAPLTIQENLSVSGVLALLPLQRPFPE